MKIMRIEDAAAEIVEVPEGNLAKSGGRYIITTEEGVESLAVLPVGEGTNATVRAKKFAARHEAIDILDTEALDALFKRKPVREKPPERKFNQAALLDDPDEEPDEEPEEDDDEDLRALLGGEDGDEGDEDEGDEDEEDEGDGEAALDLKLLEWGYSADQVDGYTLAQKTDLVRREVKKTPTIDKGPGESPVVEPEKTRRPRAPSPGSRRAEARRDALRGGRSRPTEDEIPPVAIRGYRLRVSRPTWPTSADASGQQVPRSYSVGDSADLSEVQATAERWSAAGFTCVVEPLPWHHKAPTARRTIWDGEPFEPILCMFPDCTWVGDHLVPHTRHHGLNLEEYRRGYHYVGPPVVGAAAASLASAQDAIRRRSDLNEGQFLVEIKGTHEASVWRIVKITGPEADRKFVVAPVTGDDSGPRATFGSNELTARFKPVVSWAHRLLKDLGVARRKKG